MVQESYLHNSHPKIHVMGDSDIVSWRVHTDTKRIIFSTD